MATTPALGPFACDVTLRVVRAPTFGREERDGITYLVGRGYELSYETILRFASGEELAIKAILIGELNLQDVIRDPRNACRVVDMCKGKR
jgi:hypothetical protein